MWLYLPDAFLSIVAFRDDPDCLLVRARVRGDIERVFPGVETGETPDADYRFRAVIDRQIVADAIAGRLLEISYPNFKASVTDDERHAVYLDVWMDTREEFDGAKRPSAAALLGSKGGKKGGPARAAKLSPERRSEIARKAADKRWKR